MRSSLHLTPKVTLTFVLFAAVLLIVVGVLAYTNGRDALEAATFSDLLSGAIEKEAAFESWLMAGETQISSIAQSPFIQSRLATMRSETESDVLLASHAQIVAELLPMVGEGHIFISLTVLDPDTGKVIAATESSEEGKFKEDRLYFINGKNGPYIQNVYFALECQCPAMTASAPIRSSDGTLLAVLAGRLNLDEMRIIISRETGIRQSADAYLVNTANLLVTQPRLLADPVILQRGIRTEATRQCLAGKSGSVLSSDYRDVPVMSIYRWLPNRELCLVVKVDRAEALAPVYVFGRTLLLIGVITLLIASILAVALARTITGPVRALKERVTRFGQGEMNLRVPRFSDDEIGDLGQEFNTMADAIVEKEMLLQNYAKDLEQRVAERTAKLTFLADASQALSESFDYSERLKKVAQLSVPTIADWCSVDILDRDGALQRLAVVHTDPQKVTLAYELQRRNPPDPNAPRGAYHVLNTGQPEFYQEITDELLVATIRDNEILTLVRELGLKSSMTVPLLAQGRTLGVITFVMAESGRIYDEDDLSLAQDLAHRAGLLIDNAKLYYETQQLNAELEKRVDERTAHLRAVNKELEAFSYSVSHDLRAPLRAVDGFSQALLEDYNAILDDMGRDFLNRIRTESQRMGQLIDDLIGLSRFTRTEMEVRVFSLSQMVHDIAAALQTQAPDRDVVFSIQDNLTVCGDESLIRVVLQNLMNNAWKFTAKKAPAHIEFGCSHQGTVVEYYLRDNGAGFDMAYANKLFGAFQRLHKMDEYEGTGIGLATAQRIIHRHGGSIRAESEVDKGATFCFTLDDGGCE